MKQHTVIATAVMLAVAGFVALAILAYALLWNYQSTLVLENASGDTYNGRWLVDTHPKALVDGSFIQADGEDVYFPAGYVAVLGLNQGTAPWAYYPGPVTVGARNYLVYMGSPNHTRDQYWIASASDTMEVNDDASLDIEFLLLLEADVYPFNAPTIPGSPGWQAILVKPHAYGLYLSNTPSYVFQICTAAGCSHISIDATLNSLASLSATYNGGTMTFNGPDGQHQLTKSGTITNSGSNVKVAEFNGLLNDANIRTE